MKSIRRLLLSGSLSLTFIAVLVTLVLILPVGFYALEKQANVHATRGSLLAAETVKIFWDEISRSLNLLGRVRGFSEIKPELAGSVMEALMRQNNAFELVVLYDRTGRILVEKSPYGRKALNSVNQEIFFRRAATRHEEFLSQPIYDPLLKSSFVIFSIPVRNQADQIDGVLMAHVNLHHISFLLSRIQMDLEGAVWLSDRKGVPIASGTNLSNEYLADMQQLLLQNKKQQQLQMNGEVSFDRYPGGFGQDVLGSARTLFGTPWLVIAEVPYSLISTPLQNMLILTLSGALVSLLIVFLISRKITRKITDPLNQMVKAADQVSRGEYHAGLSIESPAEFALVADAFNEMTHKVEGAIADLQNLNDQLEHRVEDRTRELSDTLRELKRTQQELIESEKMVALGELVAGIAHEINTPVGICVTACSHVQDDLTELQKAFDAKSLTPSMLQEHIDQTTDAYQLVRSNLDRASQLISDFKKVAVDQSHSESREFLLVDYVRAVSNSLTPTLKKKKHTVEVSGPEELEVFHNPGAVSQIVVNLIMNSVIHGFDQKDQGRIMIDIHLSETGDVVLEYSDNGKGMDEEQQSKIFHPFYTTRRGSGGSGLGGNIIYNLVTQSLKGSIRVYSESDQGVHFTLCFPVSAPQQSVME